MAVGKSVPRKEALDKVTGVAKYTSDWMAPGILHAKMVISPYAHAKIKSIDTAAARSVSGVRAVVTGRDQVVLTGEEIRDRPILAADRVRYHGEPVAVVVAESEAAAKRAAGLVKVEYQPLPVVNSPTQALQPDAPLIHERLGEYERIPGVYPEPGTNIANRTKIRKGNLDKGWMESEVIAKASFSFPQSDHAAMETRAVTAEILPDGQIIIHSSTQSPFMVERLMSRYLNLAQGQIIVRTPLVGGAYGGKVPVQLELIAYLAARAVGGRKVKLVNSRKEDFITSPVHIGLDAKIKLGCTREGKLKAAEIIFLFDGGAYSDKAVHCRDLSGGREKRSYGNQQTGAAARGSAAWQFGVAVGACVGVGPHPRGHPSGRFARLGRPLPFCHPGSGKMEPCCLCRIRLGAGTLFAMRVAGRGLAGSGNRGAACRPAVCHPVGDR